MQVPGVKCCTQGLACSFGGGVSRGLAGVGP